MTNRIVRFIKEVDLVSEDRCDNMWHVVSEGTVTPLALLANCESKDLDLNDSIYQECKIHGTLFALMGGGCPAYREIEDIKAAAGEQMSLPTPQAEWLVANGLAEYPTHAEEVDESVDNTIARTNRILDEMGLPSIDEESYRTIRVEGKKGSGHYARPRDTGLADSLGLSPDDIADMRDWGSAK